MIIQPDKGTRNVNDLFYETERSRIDLLNQEFFHNVELAKAENDVLVGINGLLKRLCQHLRRCENDGKRIVCKVI